MTFRIIGGHFRNRLLKSPKGDQTRPTLAVMRKAVFDILQTNIQKTHFLDLFAGSGAMGLEALSRGASQATFVENHRAALHCIQANIATLKVESQCTVLSMDAQAALKKFSKEGKRFDIIYVDPPYAIAEGLQDLLHFFDTHTLLNPGGTLFLEEAAPPLLTAPSLQTLRFIDTRTFSRSALHQFRTCI